LLAKAGGGSISSSSNSNSSDDESGAIDEIGAKHLKNLNQPTMDQESDGNSLGSNDLFDAPKGPPFAKPLLAAGLKAKQKSKEEEESMKPAKSCDVDPRSGDHLKDTNQPKT
jgi:hypothetical protein